MTKKRSSKCALLMSGLAMLTCMTMLIGSTFAWFTDSVTSSGNIIKSGTLDVSMEWADGTKPVPEDDSTEWTDASTGAIFNNEKWEPGYVEVRHLKIENKGTLALKYQLNIAANREVSELADVIDVYYADPAVQVPDRTALSDGNKLGTLTAALAGISTTASGNLEAGDTHTITIALKMQESADNDYQNLSIGSDFAIQLFATQLTSEFDSFDNQYDVGATWVGSIPATLDDTTLVIEPTLGQQTGTITINSPEDLVYLNKLAQEWVSIYSNGQGTNVGSYRENVGGKGTDYYYHWTWAIELAADLNMSNIPMESIDISYWDDFEGNGHTISNVVLKDGQNGLFNNGAKAISNLTVKNITVNAPSTQTVGAVAGNGAMTNVHVENAIVNGGKYVGGICGKGSSFVNCSIKNSTVIGNDKTVGGLVGYSIGDPDAASVTGNTVENVTVTGAYNVGGLLGQSQNETVEGNTVKNVTIMSTSKLPANASSNEVLAAELAARSAFANTIIGNNTIDNVTIDTVTGVKTADELVGAFANLKAGDTIYLLNDIDMTGKTISPVTGNKGFTMIGNGHTISNLNSNNAALFVSHSGSSSYTFDGVVLEKCAVDSTTNYGALFVGDGDTSDAITIKNCEVKNCTVKSAKYAAALIGYTAGYNVVNNGPVYSDILIENCSVIGGSITGGGSVGAAIGHAGGNVDTTNTITSLNVDGVAINGEDAAHTGIVVGTANVGKTIINGTTHTGVTGNYNTATVLYGRFVPGSTGTLTIDGTVVQ